MCITPAEREKKKDSGTTDGRSKTGEREGGRENEYIAVIIAIDFYRQTITLDSWRLPSCSDDAFFSFSFFFFSLLRASQRALPLSFSLLLRLSTLCPLLIRG